MVFAFSFLFNYSLEQLYIFATILAKRHHKRSQSIHTHTTPIEQLHTSLLGSKHEFAAGHSS